jgi:hypothetical protein
MAQQAAARADRFDEAFLVARLRNPKTGDKRL